MEPSSQKQKEVGQLKCPAGYYLRGNQCILARQYRTTTDLPRVVPPVPDEPFVPEPEPEPEDPDELPDIPSLPPEPPPPVIPDPEPPTPDPPTPDPPTPDPPTPDPPTPDPPTPPEPPTPDPPKKKKDEKSKGAQVRDTIIGGTTLAGGTAVGIKGAQAIASAISGEGAVVEAGAFPTLALQEETDALLGDIEMGQVSSSAAESGEVIEGMEGVFQDVALGSSEVAEASAGAAETAGAGAETVGLITGMTSLEIGEATAVGGAEAAGLAATEGGIFAAGAAGAPETLGLSLAAAALVGTGVAVYYEGEEIESGLETAGDAVASGTQQALETVGEGVVSSANSVAKEGKKIGKDISHAFNSIF